MKGFESDDNLYSIHADMVKTLQNFLELHNKVYAPTISSMNNSSDSRWSKFNANANYVVGNDYSQYLYIRNKFNRTSNDLFENKDEISGISYEWVL